MAVRPLIHVHNETRGLRSILGAVILGFGMSGCGTVGTIASLVDTATSDTAAKPSAQNELQRALGYWGQAYAKNPGDAKAAVAFSKNLVAAGQAKRALSVLQQATQSNSRDSNLASEYGRLALGQGRTKLAHKVLLGAVSSGANNWRTLSALGTSFAKSGNHSEAQKYFQQALQIAPGQSSIVNNLALSYALDGKAEQAEKHLRKAVAMGGNGDKVRQNLALVLGVQGRYNDAKSVVLKDLTADKAQQNVAFLQEMINKPELGGRVAFDQTNVASAGYASKPGIRGAQKVSDQAPQGSWNAQIASVDTNPVSLTPSGR